MLDMVEWNYTWMYWIGNLLIPLGMILLYFWHDNIISFFIIIIILLIIFFILSFLFARKK